MPITDLEAATRALIFAARDVLDHPISHDKRQALRAAMARAEDELPVAGMTEGDIHSLYGLNTDASGDLVGRP